MVRAYADDDNEKWTSYDDYEVVSHDTVWSGSHVQVDILKPIVVVDGATLTIEKGTHIEFSQIFVYDGRIVAEGTDAERIVFTKMPSRIFEPEQDVGIYDAECFRIRPIGTIEFNYYPKETDNPSVFRYTEFEGIGSNQPIPAYEGHCPGLVMDTNSWMRSLFGETAYAAKQPNFTSPGINFIDGKLLIDHSAFHNGLYADIVSLLYFYDEFGARYQQITVTNSDFSLNLSNTALLSAFQYDGKQDYTGRVYFENNWYGSSDGPTSDKNPGGHGERLVGPCTLVGFSSERHLPETPQASNVLFLPGIKASYLYEKDHSGNEDRLWPPDFFSDDLDRLTLDNDGKSVNDVYTEDVLSSAGGTKYYESFLTDLETEKTNHVINDYVLFAYDWRTDVHDIAYGDTAYRDDSRSLLSETERLAQSSKTGKVTIVAHSNGGLVAKELLNRLDETGEAALVDQVVFVGTPQLGAPISILSLLYGYKEDLLWGILASRGNVRALAEHMPGAYGLLPSQEYFDRTKQPLISFSSEHTRFKTFRDAYGDTIDDWNGLADFLSGAKDGREKPEKDDVTSENVLRKNLLSQEEQTKKELDTWKPLTGVEVIEIAGWGLDTVRGIDYTEEEATRCYAFGSALIPSCTGVGTYKPVYEPQFTVDGDEVVTAPSALMLPESLDVKKYWVDLYRSKKSHADMLEVNELRTFLSQIISHKENDSVLPKYIFTSRPTSQSTDNRIRMALYSPLDISLTDADGNHTGPKTVKENGQTSVIFEEGIPGSTYVQFDDRKYASFPEGTAVAVHLDGYGTGSYTLKFDEVAVTNAGEKTLNHTTFQDLPVTPETTVDLSVPEKGLSDLSTLHADLNGSEPGGEYEVPPVSNGIATLNVAQETTVAESSSGTNTPTDHSRQQTSSEKSKSGISDSVGEFFGSIFGSPSATDVGGNDMDGRFVGISGVEGERQNQWCPFPTQSPLTFLSSVFRTSLRIMFPGPFFLSDMLSFLWKLNGTSVTWVGWFRWLQ
ncbi:MAG: hypothetical protein WCJ25_03095 [Candidatus Moraniibacteriota bacterium]